MGISTVSFNQAKIYKDKMFFTLYGKDGVCTNVFDKYGNNLLSRISYNAVTKIKSDCIVISRKKEYKLPNNEIIFEFVKKIYNKAGELLNTEKQAVKQI